MDAHRQNILLKYIPEGSLETVGEWLDQYPVSLIITRKRNTKMGDYRPPQKKDHHRISVNGDLHPYAFLVTLVHEIAHRIIWEKYQRKVQPHGIQWKNQFRDMLKILAEKNIFTKEVSSIINDFAGGKFSYRAFNLNFEKKIHEMTPGNNFYLLGDIPGNSVFSIPNGRTFIKKDKLRTRYRCQEIKSGRYYLISPLARVQLETDQG